MTTFRKMPFAALALATLLGGCNATWVDPHGYLDRRDQIWLGAGDAKEHQYRHANVRSVGPAQRQYADRDEWAAGTDRGRALPLRQSDRAARHRFVIELRANNAG